MRIIITNGARRRIWAAFITAVLAFLVTTAAAAVTSPEGQLPDASPSVAVPITSVTLPSDGLRDEAAMVLVGSALIGLAALVRRAA